MKTILLASYGQETNTFNPFPTSLAAFGTYQQQSLQFLPELQKRNDIKIIESVALYAEPWGRVEHSAHETVKRKILADFRGEKIDGVLMYMHGAMAVEDLDDAEGDLLSELRKAGGKQMPIISMLDLHANITKKMLENATAFLVYHRYPHTDISTRIRQATQLMLDTLDEKVFPCMKYRKLPLLMEFIPTENSVLHPITRLIDDSEVDKRIISASIAYGFPLADIAEGGVCTIAISNGDETCADQTAEILADNLWSVRANLQRKFLSIDHALDLAEQSSLCPVVLADCCDNPGSGATGDSTHILRRMLERNIRHAAVGIIYDPETVKPLLDVTPGTTMELMLGGKFLPEINGMPIHCNGCIEKFYFDSAYGNIAVIEIHGITVLVSDLRQQVFSWETFQKCGVDMKNTQIIVVKSTIAFRHSFSQITSMILDVRCPGVAEQCLDFMNITHCNRPVYPLDKDCVWHKI